MRLDHFKKAKEQELAMLRKAAREQTLPAPFNGLRPDFVHHLLRPQNGLPAIIAEYKRASPSCQDIALHISPEQAASAYEAAGAGALSVLTEETFFKGSLDYLSRMTAPGLPLLRKDFIFDPLQVTATIATPASAMLLIVALTPDPVLLRDLRETAQAHGIASVVEVFTPKELELARASGARIIQVNARNLETLTVDRNACLAMGCEKESGEFWIAASGMENRLHLTQAREAGYDAVLVGTSLMRGGNPEFALRRLAGRCTPQIPLEKWPRPVLKICGLKEQQDVDAAFACGADLCGFVFDGRSPRHIQPETVAGINTHGMLRVGVFVNAPLHAVRRVMNLARLDYVQLHGSETPEYCAALPRERILKAIWPERFRENDALNIPGLEAELERFAPCVAGFVLDSGQSGGGSGRTMAHNALHALRSSRPCLLAGGLCPQNVSAAWNAVSAAPGSPFAGLDLNSGVELAPGVKDAQKIRAASAALATAAPFRNNARTGA